MILIMKGVDKGGDGFGWQGLTVRVNAKRVVCHVVKDFDKIWLGVISTHMSSL